MCQVADLTLALLALHKHRGVLRQGQVRDLTERAAGQRTTKFYVSTPQPHC